MRGAGYAGGDTDKILHHGRGVGSRIQAGGLVRQQELSQIEKPVRSIVVLWRDVEEAPLPLIPVPPGCFKLA